MKDLNGIIKSLERITETYQPFGLCDHERACLREALEYFRCMRCCERCEGCEGCEKKRVG